MNIKCSKCGNENITLVQYRMTNEDYDGWSELQCLDCKIRIGRWSNKILEAGELEKASNRWLYNYDESN